MRLQDKVTIITGSGSGIGQATAILFAKEGAKVVVVDINKEGGQQTVDEIRQNGGEAIFLHTDVTNESDVAEMVEQALKRYQQIDVLFNNAGISGVGAIHDVEESTWDRVMNVNVKGVFLPSKHVVPHMMERQKGSIINMSSSLAELGLLRRTVYAASKGAVLALTKSMQVDYAPYNIRVNALLPGTTLTPFVEDYLQNHYRDREEALESIRKRQLTAQLAYPEDVAKAALFLASDDSSLMMGSPMYIDSGVTFGKMA